VPVRRFSVRSAVSFRWTSMGTWNWNLGAMVPGAGSKKQPCFTKKAVLLGWNVLRLPRPINHLALLLKQTRLTRILDLKFPGTQTQDPERPTPVDVRGRQGASNGRTHHHPRFLHQGPVCGRQRPAGGHEHEAQNAG
jgi:hypothetical protein